MRSYRTRVGCKPAGAWAVELVTFQKIVAAQVNRGILYLLRSAARLFFSLSSLFPFFSLSPLVVAAEFMSVDVVDNNVAV